MGALPSYKKCFFCSHDEPTGVRLRMGYHDGAVVSGFTIERRFQGFEGLVHGGIITGILDELMWWQVAIEARQVPMTRKIDVEFLRPMTVEMPYTAKAEPSDHGHADWRLSCIVKDGSGHEAARGTGVYRLVKKITFEHLLCHFDFTGVDPEMKEIFMPAIK